MIPKLTFRLLRRLPPERARRLAIWGLRQGFGGRSGIPYPNLRQRIWNLDFPNPLGLAAGFDKNAAAAAALAALGFGFVEVGSVTPRPQPGNPQPRIFRLEEDAAVINRMGFNNEGMERVAERIARNRGKGLLGINLGKNKETEVAAEDYAKGASLLGPLADYLVINVSSPNTPGLRALQGRAELEDLAAAVRDALYEAECDVPLLLKIAPDLGQADLEDIAAVALLNFDGLIVSNTTLARPESLKSPHKQEAGGLSGRPLFAPSTAVLSDVYRLTKGRVPLVAVGGIEDAETAWQKIRAGASLLQIYTAFAYAGPPLIADILEGLMARVKAEGFNSISAAVGSGFS